MKLLGSLLVLCGLLAPAASAHHVWVADVVFGPGADTYTVQGAINLASDGDTVLVRGGVQPAFVIDGKSLTVIADAGATVHVEGFRVRHIAAGQSVVVAGFTSDIVPTNTLGVEVLRITDCDGPVLIQDCKFFGQTQNVVGPLLPTVTVSHAAAVTFLRTTIVGRRNLPIIGSQTTAEALVSNDAQVQLAQSFVFGAGGQTAIDLGNFSILSAPGQIAIRLTDTPLVLLDSTVTGGPGGHGTYFVLSESCFPGADGGAGIVFGDEASFAVLRASVVEGGAGGTGGTNELGGSCSDGLPGAPSFGPGGMSVVGGNGNPLDVAPTVVRAGAAGLLTLHAAPDSAALLLISVGQSQLWVPGLAGVLLPAPGFLVVALGNVPASGAIALPYAAPTLPAGIDGVAVLLQSAFVRGGTATLGGVGALVMLDASL